MVFSRTGWGRVDSRLDRGTGSPESSTAPAEFDGYVAESERLEQSEAARGAQLSSGARADQSTFDESGVRFFIPPRLQFTSRFRASLKSSMTV